MNRRKLTIALCLAPAAAVPLPARAQPAGYPARPIRYLVAAAPATPPDLLARVVAEGLAARLAQPVIVENRPGAIGSIGLRALAAAPADGYTIGALAMPWVIGTHVLKGPVVDAARELQAVALLARNYALLVVSAGSPWRSVRDLVAAARAQPDALAYASAGSATPSHLAAKLLERAENLRLRHVPYSSAVTAASAVLAGDAQLAFGHAGAFLQHVRAGRLRALATTGARRLASAPDVPTMQEAGVNGVVVSDWQALVAPRGTPREIVERLHAAVAAVLDGSEVTSRLVAAGIEPAAAGPDELATLIADESRRWAALVREVGITVD